MAGAEVRPAEQAPRDPIPPSNPAKDAFTAAMGNYEELLTEVGVVEFSMLGMKPGLRTGYLFNVLTQDFTPEQMQEDPRFARLSEGSAVAMDQSRGYIPLRMANVAPSHAAEIRRRYEENGVKFEMQSVRTPEVAFVWELSGQQEAQDVLTGGLTSADDVIQAAAEIATGIEDDSGEDRASVEETFGFDILDRIKDERARAILKDIAFVRNARIRESGLAQRFALLAEPVRVLSELVNIHDEAVSSITELDVRAAIESRALATDFSVLPTVSERTVDITLETRLEDIPDADPCEICGDPNQERTFLQQVMTGRELFIQASVPGYRCQNEECGITSFSIEGIIESLGAASRILRDSGDTATADAFDQHIALEQQIIALRARPLGEGSQESLV